MTHFVDSVAAHATTVRPLRLLLSLLAAPFYALGYVAGLVVVALTWVIAAGQLGVADARASRSADSA